MTEVVKSGQDPAVAPLYADLGNQLRNLNEQVAQQFAGQAGLESISNIAAGAVKGHESVGELTKWGKEYFEKISSLAYDAVCGNNADWKSVVSQGEKALTSAIAVLLTAHLGLVAGIAGAVAAIAVKIFFDAGQEELCSKWKAALPSA